MRVLALFKVPTPYLAPLFRLLAKSEGIDLTVVYGIRLGDEYEFYDYKSKKFIKYGVNVLEGYNYKFLEKNIRKTDAKEYKVYNIRIVSEILNGNYDVILNGLSYWSPCTWMALVVAKAKKIPIVTRATVEAGRKRNHFLLALKHVVVGSYLRNIKAGVYECRSQKEYLIQYGMKESEVFFAPCAVENEYFIQKKDDICKEEVRRSLGISDKTTVIIDVAMLIPRKRPMDVISAIEILNRKGYDIALYLLGNGELEEELKNYIADKGISNVFFTGRIPQNRVAEYLAASDIFLIASENDASPKALNEAMNFELPIVVSDAVETLDQLLKPGINGYSFSVGNVGEMANCIESIIKGNRQKEMGLESARIVTEFDFKRVVDSWITAMRYAIETDA